MAKVVASGAINIDINLFVERFPKTGEEVPIARLDRVYGGKGANVAVSAARYLGKREVALLGCVGSDEIGRQQVTELEGEGVDTALIKKVSGVESGQAYIVIDRSGSNVIHTLFGANLEINAADIEEKARAELVKNSEVVVIVDPPLDVVRKLQQTAKSAGKTVMWDPATLCTLGMKKLGEEIKKADYVLLNEVEVENLTGLSNAVDASRKLAFVNKNLKVVVKKGAEGCTLVSRESTIEIRGIALEKMGMKVVNTVGAGDAFLGVFAAAKSLGMDDETALKLANAAGAFKCTRAETRGSPTRGELEKFVGRMGE
jgi:ribokinase